MSCCRSCSTRSGLSDRVRPSRFATRFTWVSTTILGWPKAFPRMTFAVFLPTPGKVINSSIALRNLLPEAFGYRFAAGDKMFCLIFKEAGGTNDLFDIRKMSGCQFCRMPIPLKERWSDQINPLVGTLGGEDRGDKQLPRGTMIQFHLWVWHRALKRLRNLSKTCPWIR